jgi:hypothetical protein
MHLIHADKKQNPLIMYTKVRSNRQENYLTPGPSPSQERGDVSGAFYYEKKVTYRCRRYFPLLNRRGWPKAG